MRYAINICDLTRNDSFITSLVIGPVTPGRIIVDANPNRVDEGALILECDAKRALAIIGVFRMKDAQAKRYATRGYQEGTRGGWSKVK